MGSTRRCGRASQLWVVQARASTRAQAQLSGFSRRASSEPRIQVRAPMARPNISTSPDQPPARQTGVMTISDSHSRLVQGLPRTV